MIPVVLNPIYILLANSLRINKNANSGTVYCLEFEVSCLNPGQLAKTTTQLI
jgi:hypothetical protein